jgi:hypothetical protein
MAQTFCLANRPDPRLDEDGKPSLRKELDKISDTTKH